MAITFSGKTDACSASGSGLAFIAAAYVAWDAFTNNPEMTVMKWGWVLVALYTGVVGLSFYVLFL